MDALEIKAEEQKEEKMGQVLSMCYGCGKKFRKEDEEVNFISIQIPIYVSPDKIAPSLPVFVCLKCGTIHFPNRSREQIKQNIERGKSKIIIPKIGGVYPK